MTKTVRISIPVLHQNTEVSELLFDPLLQRPPTSLVFFFTLTSFSILRERSSYNSLPVFIRVLPIPSFTPIGQTKKKKIWLLKFKKSDQTNIHQVVDILLNFPCTYTLHTSYTHGINVLFNHLT